MLNRILSGLLILVVTFVSHQMLCAQPEWKSKGIGLRMAMWNMGNRDNVIHYIRENGREFVETSGFGGWIYFYSRTGERWMFEFNLGAFGQAVGEFNHHENYDATAVIPVLLGMQREFMTIQNSSSLRPYISLGGGMYWITDVTERQSANREEVFSRVEPGAYFGGGMNFFLSPSFALNCDLKYHMVDLQTGNDLSGVEFGIGFSISWGSMNDKTSADDKSR